MLDVFSYILGWVWYKQIFQQPCALLEICQSVTITNLKTSKNNYFFSIVAHSIAVAGSQALRPLWDQVATAALPYVSRIH